MVWHQSCARRQPHARVTLCTITWLSMCVLAFLWRHVGSCGHAGSRGEMDPVVTAALCSWSRSVARLEGKADLLASRSPSGCSCMEWEGFPWTSVGRIHIDGRRRASDLVLSPGAAIFRLHPGCVPELP